jgi:hypothetical protein
MACNLQPDPPNPTNFKGTTGNAVSLTVKGTNGNARMIAARYAGSNIGTNPATFNIQAGSQILSLTFDNDTPGDPTNLLCDDGSVLHQFPFDHNDPNIFYVIRGA